MDPIVIAVSRSPGYTFSKANEARVTLVSGLGVAGDAHAGQTVKHRYLAAQDPTRPNLRQVHLIHAELFDELQAQGFSVMPGQVGENITTRGIDLLALPVGTKLHLGAEAVVEVTGLRSPCRQLDNFQSGLKAAVLDRDDQGRLIRKAGIMSIVLTGGEVRPGDPIAVVLPPEPHQPLEVV